MILYNKDNSINICVSIYFRVIIRISIYIRVSVCQQIRKGKARYDRMIIEGNANDLRYFWKVIKNILPNKSMKSQDYTTNPRKL